MFLKMIKATLSLPFFVSQQGKAFEFPAARQLPSVCIEEFTQVGAQQLMGKFPGTFAQASQKEVDEAIKLAKSESGTTIVTQPELMEPGTVLVGTVTAGDFADMAPEAAGEFLAASGLTREVAEKLHATIKALPKKKELAKVVGDFIAQLK